MRAQVTQLTIKEVIEKFLIVFRLQQLDFEFESLFRALQLGIKNDYQKQFSTFLQSQKLITFLNLQLIDSCYIKSYVRIFITLTILITIAERIQKNSQVGRECSIFMPTGVLWGQMYGFSNLACTILMFYNWKTPLNDSIMGVVWFVGLLVVNSYFMLMSGRNPGFETRKINKKQEEILLEQYQLVKAKQSQSISYVRAQQQQNSQLLNQSHSKQQHNQPQQQSSLISDTQPQHSPSLSDQISTSVSQCIPCPQKSNPITSQATLSHISIQNYCKICNCLKRNRMKHCYSCGKCVMKFDHHCPWIGACVGEQNHFMFLLCLLFHTLQSVTTFYICIKALDEYKYYDQQNDTFSTQFGVLVLWCFFMCFYIVFAGCLLFFHLYLVSANITTRQLMSRRKCEYLRGIQGNPYDEGILRNLQYAICPDQNGREWIVSETLSSQNREKSWYQKIWKNQYYECC